MADKDDTEDSAKVTQQPHSKAADVSHEEAIKRYDRGWNKDRHNIAAAYDDLNFLAGTQWLPDLERQRLNDGRPVLTFNRCGQFVRQVTGDIRQMKPAISVVPVSSGADEKIAEIREGLIRHIEDASDATISVYPDAADSQVGCGIGHWEVAGEYGDETDYEQNLIIRPIDDQVSVIWDPDSKKKTRADALFCFVPVDMTREAYEETYPEYPVDDIGSWEGNYIDNWFDADRVRVARYWYKVKTKKRLVKMPTGEVFDVTPEDNSKEAKAESREQEAQYVMLGGMAYEREGYKVFHRMMNCNQFLEEPQAWPGRFIPIIPVIGEEVRAGGRVDRFGIVRFLADPQRAYNYARSTQTEFVGLQPKAPYVGTEENFKDFEEQWDTANVKNWPYLPYRPDPKNGNVPPQRLQPPTSSPGLTECVMDALNDMQGVVGIYNASLGAKSNEDSGRAIKFREAQTDTGTYVYMANFALAIAHTARVLNDLIPHYYDTARQIRILGLDGKSTMVQINQPQDGLTIDGVDPIKMNDITIGTYDIQMEMGPSYATQREAAREGIVEFIKAFPPSAPLLSDMFADMQDWPQKEEIVDRMRTLLPPQIQAQIAKKDNKPIPPPVPPNPVELATAQAEIAKAQSTAATSQLDVKIKELSVAQQQAVTAKAEIDLMLAQVQAQGVASFDPSQMEAIQQQVVQMGEALTFLSEHAAQNVGPEGPMPPPPEEEEPKEEPQSEQAQPAEQAPEPQPEPVAEPEKPKVAKRLTIKRDKAGKMAEILIDHE